MSAKAVLAIIFAAILVISPAAYAAPRWQVPPKVSNTDMNKPVGATVRTTAKIGGPQAKISAAVRARIETALKRLAPEVNAERVIERAMAHRQSAGRIIARAEEIAREHRQNMFRYKHINDAMRKTAEQIRVQMSEWMRVRAEFQKGQIDENTYFTKTKEFLLTAIDATIERLEAIKETVDNESLISAIDNRISELQNLKEKVLSAETLDDLRAIYPEIRSKIYAIQKEYVLRAYAHSTVEIANSILKQLDVAAARLSATVESMKENGTYDENIDAKVTEIYAKIETIRTELNTLSQQIDSGEIDFQQFVQEIRTLRKNIREVYYDIRTLYRTATERLRLQIRERARVENNASADVNTVRKEVEQENYGTTVEENVTEEVNA